MKSTFLSMAFALFCAAQVHSSVIFVKEGARGNGTSWIDALGNLQQALATAKAGDEIWVSEGKYYPVNCNFCEHTERLVAFNIPDGIKLYGGFSGFETSLGQRKWYAHPTTLSGNIGAEEAWDNSYTVVYTRNVSGETVVDGFVIADGCADKMAVEGSPLRAGGGWFNDGSGIGGHSSPTIRNCVFLNNYALEGGAMFNHGAQGECSPELINCAFVSNKAERGGGAIFNNSENGISKMKMKKGKFVSNEAPFGGAVFFAGHFGDGFATFTSTHFVNNKAVAGSALFSLGQPLKNQPEFFLCVYHNNVSQEGDENFFQPGNEVPKHLLKSLAVPVSVKI